MPAQLLMRVLFPNPPNSMKFGAQPTPEVDAARPRVWHSYLKLLACKKAPARSTGIPASLFYLKITESNPLILPDK